MADVIYTPGKQDYEVVTLRIHIPSGTPDDIRQKIVSAVRESAVKSAHIVYDHWKLGTFFLD